MGPDGGSGSASVGFSPKSRREGSFEGCEGMGNGEVLAGVRDCTVYAICVCTYDVVPSLLSLFRAMRTRNKNFATLRGSFMHSLIRMRLC